MNGIGHQFFACTVAIIARFTGGIGGYVTNLTNARPWGIWVGINVATGVALAAGGFTTAALAQKGTDFSLMKSQGRDVGHLIDKTDYINFKALGYEGDPIIHGGRFKKLPMGYQSQARTE